MFRRKLCLVATAAMAPLAFASNPQTADIEIVVDARGNASINQPLNDTKTVTADEIETSGASSLHDVFQNLLQLPISGDSVGNGVLGFPDLGGYGEAAKSNTLILVNGRPLNNATLEAPNLSFIPLNSIVRIDVHQGGSGTLFGSGATGGVINIVTKQASMNLDNEIYVRSGSFGFSSTGATAATELNDTYSMVATAEVTSKDGYRHHTDFQNSAGSITFANTQLDTRWNISYSNAFQQRKDSGAAALDAVKDDRKVSGRNTNLDHRSELFLFDYADITESSQYNLHFSHRESDQLGTDTPPTGQKTKTSNMDFSHQNTQTNAVYGVSAQRSAYEGFHQGIRYQNRVDAYLRRQSDRDRASKTTAGIRVAYVNDILSNENQKEQFATAGEFIHERRTRFGRVKLGIDRAFRYANLDENASTILKPQIVDTGTVQLQRSSTTSTLFYSDITNEIIYDSVKEANVNLDETSRYGIRIFHTKRMDDRTKLSASAQWLQAKIESGSFQGKDVPGVPNFSSGLKLTHQLSGNQTLQISSNYVSSSYPFSDFDNSLGKTNDHFITNTSWSYSKDGLRGVFRINNVLDATYNTYEIDSFSGHAITPAEPINFEIGVSYEF
jgi:iron complex outermembrane receptor protein